MDREPAYMVLLDLLNQRNRQGGLGKNDVQGVAHQHIEEYQWELIEHMLSAIEIPGNSYQASTTALSFNEQLSTLAIEAISERVRQEIGVCMKRLEDDYINPACGG